MWRCVTSPAVSLVELVNTMRKDPMAACATLTVMLSGRNIN